MAFVRMLAAAAEAPEHRQAASCRSFPTRRAPSAWSRSSASAASTRSQGQLYEPVDRDAAALLPEAKDGQILEEGINEAGSMASASSPPARPTHARRPDDPVLHLLLDVRLPARRRPDLGRRPTCAREGFLIGATAGRTTLNGEGLQHEDGHSHLLALHRPEPASPTTRPLPTSSPSSSRTASSACTRTARTSSTTSPSTTKLRDAGDARGRGGGHPQGLYRLRKADARSKRRSPPARQRDDPARSAARAEHPRREVRRRLRRLERDQLQAAAPRRARVRARGTCSTPSKPSACRT